MLNKENTRKDIKFFRDYLYHAQVEFERDCKDEFLIDQSIRVKQRISALLDIYSQIICEDRKFNENYLERYL